MSSYCLLLLSVLVVCAAQPHCDPITQYEEAGRCCTKCGPGTSMFSSSCEDPQCRDCGTREYQETYTTATSCQRQPYCDPNKNFQESGEESPRRRSLCLCRRGFHCSSEACLTCVPHQECPPGTGAQSPGNHSQDSVCVPCPRGFFSSSSSWNASCQPWSRCDGGNDLQRDGTASSDAVCAPQQRALLLPLILSILLLLLIITAAFVCYKQRGKRDYFNLKAKSCCERGLVAPPAASPDSEMGELRTPVENEDEDESLRHSDLQRTFSGKVLAQEDGKMDVLSRQESQPGGE